MFTNRVSFAIGSAAFQLCNLIRDFTHQLLITAASTVTSTATSPSVRVFTVRGWALARCEQHLALGGLAGTPGRVDVEQRRLFRLLVARALLRA